jgi:predicted Zn-dependent protease with MMP-like domain
MEKQSFEELLLIALKELPVKFRHRMENVEIVIEDRPSRELLKERGINSKNLLLGLYQGVPITKRGTYYTNVLPDKITIFRENIEMAAGSDDNVRETLKRVIIHEIGHYYGLDEKDMR